MTPHADVQARMWSFERGRAEWEAYARPFGSPDSSVVASGGASADGRLRSRVGRQTWTCPGRVRPEVAPVVGGVVSGGSRRDAVQRGAEDFGSGPVECLP